MSAATLPGLSVAARRNLDTEGFAEWTVDIDQRCTACLQQHDLRFVQAFAGAMCGICWLMQTSDGQPVVFKALPPADTDVQINCLRIMNGINAPLVVEVLAQDMFLMQYLPGVSGTQILDDNHGKDILQWSSFTQLLAGWRTITVDDQNGLPTAHEKVGGTIEHVSRKGNPPALQQALLFAEGLLGQVRMEANICHGDLGLHNLLLDGEDVRAVDPLGCIGPTALDAGSLALSGRNFPGNAVEGCARLSENLGIDQQEIAAWAIMRAATSMGYAFGVGEKAAYHAYQ